jgi:tetraacyldisaccharide 4'-kinase
VRNWLYDIGLFKTYRVPSKVISIGGISFGGAGKTPMAILVAKTLMQKEPSRRIAIISRGYRRKSRGTKVVSDGYNITASVREAGDELFLIAKNVPGVIAIADENRLRGARCAIEKFSANAIILDDAFQHRSLYRDLNIVLIEPEIALKPGTYFLREQLPSLKRADIVVILDAEEDSQDTITNILKQFIPAGIGFGKRLPGNIKSITDDTIIKIETLRSRKILAFCALAKPERFLNTLKDLGLGPFAFLTFPDHCDYNPEIINSIAKKASDAEILITTEKDAIKLPAFINNIPIYYLTLKIEIENEEKLIKSVLVT